MLLVGGVGLVLGLVGLMGVVLAAVRGERETTPSAVGSGSPPASSGTSEACTLPTTSNGE